MSVSLFNGCGASLSGGTYRRDERAEERGRLPAGLQRPRQKMRVRTLERYVDANLPAVGGYAFLSELTDQRDNTSDV
jgi:hypothetical protein